MSDGNSLYSGLQNLYVYGYYEVTKKGRELFCMDKVKTGNLIREARNKKGYTQSELGDLIGVTNKAVSRWENGESFPDVGVLEELGNVLGLDIRSIVSGEGEIMVDDAVTEIARIARIQARERKRNAIYINISIIVLAILLFMSVSVFSGNMSLSKTVFYPIVLVITAIIVFLSVKLGKTVSAESKKRNKWLLIFSLFLGVYMIAGTSITLCLASQVKTPANIGVILNIQLLIIFLFSVVSLLILSYRCCYKAEKEHFGMMILLINIFLSVSYSDFLHRIDTLEATAGKLIIGSAVIIAIEVAAFVTGTVVGRIKK